MISHQLEPDLGTLPPMIRTAWASAPLSFLIVVVAAVALFEPEPIAGDPSQESPLSRPELELDTPATIPDVPSPTPAESGGLLAIAIVGPLGESLAEVALRIYGTPDALPALWQANRELVADPEATLPPGTALRTP